VSGAERRLYITEKSITERIKTRIRRFEGMGQVNEEVRGVSKIIKGSRGKPSEKRHRTGEVVVADVSTGRLKLDIFQMQRGNRIRRSCLLRDKEEAPSGRRRELGTRRRTRTRKWERGEKKKGLLLVTLL